MAKKKKTIIPLTEKEQNEIAEEYCFNNEKKIKMLCHTYVNANNINGIYQKDYDELYSLGQMVLCVCLKKFNKNKSASFDTFYSMVLKKRIYDTYNRNRYRQCRSNTVKKEDGSFEFIADTSLSALNDNISQPQYNDVYLEDDRLFDVSEDVEKYLNKLSKKQRKFAFLIMEGYDKKEIKKILKINTSQYNNLMKGLKAYRNIQILFKY